MDKQDINLALGNVLKMDPLGIAIFAINGLNLGRTVGGRQVVSLNELNKHLAIEHDASLTRSDANITGADAVRFNNTLWQQFKSFSKDGKYITKEQFAAFRVAREDDSRLRNPFFDFSLKSQFTAYGEAALLWLSFNVRQGERDLGMRVDWLDFFFTQEKFPTVLGWQPNPNLSTVKILGQAFELKALSAKLTGASNVDVAVFFFRFANEIIELIRSIDSGVDASKMVAEEAGKALLKVFGISL
jgi:hypothetical protein